jgi:hypothetical protein
MVRGKTLSFGMPHPSKMEKYHVKILSFRNISGHASNN